MKLTAHPISLNEVLVGELSIVLSQPSTTISLEDIPSPRILISHTHFHEDTNRLSVAMKCEITADDYKDRQEDEKPAPVELLVVLIAFFNVDVEAFPPDKVDEWAQSNSPFVIHPFLREHVYSLTMRAGIPPIVLPLVQVPTFHIDPVVE